jgi:transposase InsO family protein
MYKAFIRCGLPEAILSDRGSQFKPSRQGGEANYQWYAHQLGIDPLFGQKPQTKGKIEGLFHFVQRDFVMENIHLTTIKEVNEAFGRWLDNYNFNHEHKRINKQCPADLYTESLRRPRRQCGRVNSRVIGGVTSWWYRPDRLSS